MGASITLSCKFAEPTTIDPLDEPELPVLVFVGLLLPQPVTSSRAATIVAPRIIFFVRSMASPVDASELLWGASPHVHGGRLVSVSLPDSKVTPRCSYPRDLRFDYLGGHSVCSAGRPLRVPSRYAARHDDSLQHRQPEVGEDCEQCNKHRPGHHLRVVLLGLAVEDVPA